MVLRLGLSGVDIKLYRHFDILGKRDTGFDYPPAATNIISITDPSCNCVVACSRGRSAVLSTSTRTGVADKLSCPRSSDTEIGSAKLELDLPLTMIVMASLSLYGCQGW